MPKRVVLYVIGVTIAAAAALAALAVIGPVASARTASISAFLCITGWVGRRLTHEGSTVGLEGRVYYLVFPAAGLACTDWTASIAAGVTVFAIDAARRDGRPWIKVVFNAATVTLASALSILAYRAVGGQPWTSHINVAGVPLLSLMVTSRIVNEAAVTGVLSLAEQRRVLPTWREVTGRTLVDDVLVAPLIGLLAYAISVWGYLGTLAIAASLIWVNRLYVANRELERGSEELLELVVGAIEARDPYTSGHSRRVSRMAVEIGQAIGLPQDTVKRLGVAGLLHDVGKIHEKYAVILQKSERLTRDEWLLMKEHPADGEALVAKVSRLHDILPAVRHHHEKWDGSGYPDGLRGEAIPLAARILALADTIDAMTSDRPYRRGLTREEVHAEVQRCAGSQFDPVIARQLLASPAWATLIVPNEPAADARYEIRLVGSQA